MVRAIAQTTAAVVAVALAIKTIASLLGGRAFQGLSGIVSYSSKLIAASRAVESQEAHPLVSDPLAEEMAGAAAVASSRRRAPAAPAGSKRQFKIGKMAIRTRWFDDQIEAALGMPIAISVPACLRAANAPAQIDMPAYIWTHPNGHEPRQVVMLGAGMDSRPWRMKLPADLHWYELDQADVVEAKQKLLRQLAAEVPALPAEQRHEAGSPRESGLSRHLSIDKVQHPLRCGSWTAVACDLSDPSWADALLAAGFDPSKPAVWVAEGLLMYLEEGRVRSMLSKMAELSTDGSVLVGLSITQAVIDRMRARSQGKAGAASNSNGSAAKPSLLDRLGVRTQRPGGSLTDTWVFGCPEDPTELFASCGWQLRLVTDRAKQAAALGLAPELCAFPAGDEAKQDDGPGSLFIAATPLAAAAGKQ